MNTLRYIRMVLWSFFGIRRRAGADAEFATLKPLPLILTGIAVAATLVALLISLAAAAVGGLG